MLKTASGVYRQVIVNRSEHAPWKEFAQVEQDLIISRALVEIFSDDFPIEVNNPWFTGKANIKTYDIN